MPDLNKKVLKEILDAFTDSHKKESVEIYSIAKQVILNNYYPEDIEDILFLIQHNYQKIINGYVAKELLNGNEQHKNIDDISFLIKQKEFVINIIEKLIKDVEGDCCYADKANRIHTYLLTYFVTGKEIDLQKDEFYNPHKILRTKEDVLEFYKAIVSLYHGDINTIQNIITSFFRKKINSV